jgi:hypothetical protein
LIDSDQVLVLHSSIGFVWGRGLVVSKYRNDSNPLSNLKKRTC